jgi:fatty acid desaturase
MATGGTLGLTMLRYRADSRTIGLVGFYWLLFAADWLLGFRGIWAVPLVAATCLSSWICAVAAHNTVHCPVFKKRWMNRVFQTWLSLSYGFPISEYLPGHNLSHHRFTQLKEDVMRTSKVNFRWNLLNLGLFFFYVAPAVTAGNYRYRRAVRGTRVAWNRQLTTEIVAVWSVKAALLLVNWQMALLYCVIPHLFALWGITTVNFLWHDGCDPDHPTNHSRNFVSPVFNWFTLNNGYHGMHHVAPALHWSLLPRKHAVRMAGIDSRLEQRSLVVYLFKTFIYPARRETYDGKPLVVAKIPDADWVSALRPS